MSENTPTRPVLVAGGAGKTGRRVAERLEALGESVRLASRSTPVRFDWDDPSTWEAAVDGVSGAYLAYVPDLAFPGAVETIDAAGAVLARHGVERVVLLSGRGEEGALAAEDALTSHVPTARVVRGAWFTQNFTEGMFADEIAEGGLALPVSPSVREPFVDADDLADVIVTLLRDAATAGRRVDVTGPELLTFAEVVALVGDTTGPTVELTTLGPAEYVDRLVTVGLAPEEAHGMLGLFQELFDGRNEHTTDTVETYLGRPARTVREVLDRTAVPR